MEFLMRDDVNLSAEQWQSIDSAVIPVSYTHLTLPTIA